MTAQNNQNIPSAEGFLSEGWKLKTLEDVCEFDPKKSEVKDVPDDTLVGFVPMADMGKNTMAFIPRQTKKLGEVRKGYTYFRDNDVLIAKVTPCFENGKCGIARSLVNGIGFGSSEYYVLRPKNEILSTYIYYLLSSHKFLSEGAANMGGAVGLQRVNKKFISNYPIPLPPLSEQTRIVAKLDELFEHIDASMVILAENITATDAMTASVLDETFNHEVLPDGWEIAKFGDKHILEIIDGDRGQNYPKKSDFFENEYCLFLSTSNVRKGFFDFRDVNFITKEKDQLLRKGKLQKNDVILTTRGTIGNSAHFSEDIPYENVRINSGMVLLRANRERLYQQYLIQIINSSIFLDQVQNFFSGSAQPQLPIRTFSNFSFPLPPLSEQARIIERLDTIFTEAKALKTEYQTRLGALKDLKASILASAFRGEL